MTRKGFLKSIGALIGGVSLAATGFSSALGSALFAPTRPLRAAQRRFSILYALDRIGDMTPDRLDRALFESELSEQFDLGAELARMVEQGSLGQSVGADGLIYTLTGKGEEMLSNEKRPGVETLAEIDKKLESLKSGFEAERDYIAQYTEASSGIVPIFLSIRNGASILMKVNLIVPNVETAKTVTRAWMKNAHKAHRAVWDAVGEGLPFPEFSSIRKID